MSTPQRVANGSQFDGSTGAGRWTFAAPEGQTIRIRNVGYQIVGDGDVATAAVTSAKFYLVDPAAGLLAYDGGAGNPSFSAGATLTEGGDGDATATIVYAEDGDGDGYLYLKEISGTFSDGAAITDDGGDGDGDVDGAVVAEKLLIASSTDTEYAADLRRHVPLDASGNPLELWLVTTGKVGVGIAWVEYDYVRLPQ